MNTRQMIEKLLDLLDRGQIQKEQIPLGELQDCIYAEINLRQLSFSEEQMTEMKKEVKHILSLNGDRDLEQGLETLRLCLLFLGSQPIDEMKQSAKEHMDNILIAYKQVSQAYQYLKDKIREHLQTIDYIKYIHNDAKDPQITEILNYMDRHGKPEIFNYDFISEYPRERYQIYYDTDHKYPYCMFLDKRIYYPNDWGEEKILDWHRSVIYEQDERSPHCYINEGGEVAKGDVLLDAGAGEGMFTLSVIEKVSKVYIVEADPIWEEPLRLTLKDYLDKVVFVTKYLSDKDTEQEVTVDKIIGNGRINFIKMDIEGFEISALCGAKQTLQKTNLKCALCTYHRKTDAESIKEILEDFGFQTEYSKGYMYIYDDIEAVLEAQMRKGIIYGVKE